MTGLDKAKEMADKIRKESENKFMDENLTEEHSLSTTTQSNLARPFMGVPIGGFQELPVSMLTLPYVVITQTLSDVYLADGKTLAPKGEWYFTDTKQTTKEISFITLRAKVITVEVEEGGEKKIKTKLRVLCVNTETSELFIFSLPVSSFNSWGSMMAQLKKMDVKNSFEYSIRATVKPAVNKKGQKYFVGDFVIADKLTKEDLLEMREKLGEFGGALDSVQSDDSV